MLSYIPTTGRDQATELGLFAFIVIKILLKGYADGMFTRRDTQTLDNQTLMLCVVCGFVGMVVHSENVRACEGLAAAL